MSSLFSHTEYLYGFISNLTISLLCQVVIFICLYYLKSKISILRIILIEIKILIDNLMNNYFQNSKFNSIFFGLFLFIVTQNLMSFFGFSSIFTIPYITISLTFGVFILSIIIGLYLHGFAFFSAFCPNGLPLILRPFMFVIEIISFSVKPIALGIRLLLNLSVGHLLLFILSTSLPFAMFPIVLFISILEFFTGILQAYLFVNFAAHMMSLCVNEHHGDEKCQKTRD